jgi:hypothetical protein
MLKRLGPLPLLLLLLPLAPLLSSGFHPLDKTLNRTPLWWEIEMLVTTSGEYRQEEKQIACSGRYSFSILWKGSMERDDSDYLLYCLSSDLLDWEAQEKAISPGRATILTVKDFEEKPCLNLNYILKKEENLHINFEVQGFMVPRSASLDKFYLPLPVSKESSQENSPIDYDTYIVKGSNQVMIGEKDIYLGRAEKKFSWTWKHQQWLLKSNLPVFDSSSHEVKVKVTITPHF